MRGTISSHIVPFLCAQHTIFAPLAPGPKRRILVELTSHRNPVLSSNALHALLSVNQQLAFGVLEGQLEHYDSNIRWGACHVLAKYGTERSVRHVIEVFLNDPDANVRHVAAYTLGCLGSRRAIPALRHGLLHDSGTDHEGHPIAQIAADALEHLEGKE
ncbi:HEAT repeat domain-containing protein [Deinococcus aestuarii]|uniref:HEAT repeat domain-containing protein n=1 Tax=Deinococcus aestuarii TaxID=2774531 RepID=UPI003CCEBF1A